MSRGWIGVDLDGTLALAVDGNKKFGPSYIGPPVPAMAARVKQWLDAGEDVRIMTARVCGAADIAAESRLAIDAWCLEHLGRVLPITNEKDYAMRALYDDRAVQVIENTGQLLPVIFLQLAVTAAAAMRCEDHTVWGVPDDDVAPCGCAECVTVRLLLPTAHAYAEAYAQLHGPTPGNPSITCPTCARVSYNPTDIRERYCGFCHQFHDQMKAASR
jgi:hypothetical protein